MNSRKLLALFLVFALTGGALAGQQNTYHCDKSGDDADPDCDPLEAEGVTAIQQHSVFVEIVVDADVDDDDDGNQIHEFAAVVGLVKKCKKAGGGDDVSSRFDNAVLWFNDQFLFGEKNVTRQNDTSDGLGEDPTEPGENVSDDTDGDGESDQIGFYTRDGPTSGDSGARWGDCFIPDGFTHAIGADDPYASGSLENDTAGTDEDGDAENVQEGLGIPSDNMDYVKELMDLDESCQGCIFEYQSTFFVTDPNGHRWMVDKLVYPGSLQGNLFKQGPGDCPEDDGTADADDPRDNYPHHNECEDSPGGDDSKNHCSENDDGECSGSDHDDGRTAGATITEPIYTVHTQVNPRTLQGFADKARWAYADTANTEGPTRKGMPYPDDPSDANYQYCRNHTADVACSVEYDFLIAVDFAGFDNVGATAEGSGENEIRDDAIHHGPGQEHGDDAAEDGNSHPHNPEKNHSTPNHKHNALNLDLFFDKDAPYFVEENPYWDEMGAPPHVVSDCSTISAPSDNATPEEEVAQQNAVEARTPIVCDVDADQGEFHRHDGSQTIRPE